MGGASRSTPRPWTGRFRPDRDFRIWRRRWRRSSPQRPGAARRVVERRARFGSDAGAARQLRPPPERAQRAIWGRWARVSATGGGTQERRSSAGGFAAGGVAASRALRRFEARCARVPKRGGGFCRSRRSSEGGSRKATPAISRRSLGGLCREMGSARGDRSPDGRSSAGGVCGRGARCFACIAEIRGALRPRPEARGRFLQISAK